MTNYNLILSFFIFFSTLYIAINTQQKINIKTITVSVLFPITLTVITFFFIEFFKTLPYDSVSKYSFFILSPFLIYTAYKFSLLKSENLFLNISHGYKAENATIDDKLYLKFIGISFSLYGLLYFENLNILNSLIFILFPLILMIETLSTTVLLLILIFTLSLNFYLIFTTIISLCLIKLFNLLLINLNTKYYETILHSQKSHIKYRFSFNTTYEFISKFKIKTFDLSILYYYDKEENITYSIKLDLIEQLKNIINANKIKTFFLLSKYEKEINVSFNDIKFYYNKGEQYLKHNNSNEIEIFEEILDIEDHIKELTKIKEIFKY